MTVSIYDELDLNFDTESDINPIITNKHKIENLIFGLLQLIGENPEREGLQKTPKRVAKMFKELFEGYYQDINTVVNGALFENKSTTDDVVVVSDISFKSMCEHHMLPFYGKAYVGYIPNETIIGLSKIPRIVNMFSRRLQVQERLNNQILDALTEILKPKGVIVVMEGKHLCASLRGVKQEQASMKTISASGLFKDIEKKQEFLQLIKL